MLGIEPHELHRLLHPHLALSPVRNAVDREWIPDDGPDAATRVQRSIGILEDHLYIAAQCAHAPVRQVRDVPSVKLDSTRRHIGEPGDAAGQCRFAATGLPHETERFPGIDLERDTSDCLHALGAAPEKCAGTRREPLGYLVKAQEWRGCVRHRLGGLDRRHRRLFMVDLSATSTPRRDWTCRRPPAPAVPLRGSVRTRTGSAGGNCTRPAD